jgi:hypothetical protein
VTDTSTTETPLEAYKRKVREEALQVQRDMSWPDAKMNATLRALGLPEKLTFHVAVLVKAEAVVALQIDDASTEEEAREKALATPFDELRRQIRGTAWRNGEVSIYERTGEYLVGDPHVPPLIDSARYRDWCKVQDGHAGYECSLPKGHEGTQHVASNDSTVVAVWTTTPTTTA